MENEQMANQQELYDELAYYGFTCDLQIIENKMRENEPLSFDKNKGVLENFWNKNVRNENRRRAMAKLSEKKNRVLNRIEVYKGEHVNADMELDKEQLKMRIEETFVGENAFIAKTLFSLRFCLDDQIEYENKKVIYADISELLFGNENVLDELYDNMKDNYAQLIKAPIAKAQKVILKCLGVAALIAVALPPLFLGGTAITAMTVPALLESAVAEIGAGIVGVTEVVAIYSAIILGGALLGTEVVKLINGHNAKTNLRKISPEDLGFLLAVKATVIQYAKKELPDGEIKSVLDDCLKQLNDLRSDLEYLLIVERLDAEKSKKKIEICNNFTNRLVTIVGL